MAWAPPPPALSAGNPASARQADFYVAPDGSDSNPGTRSQPWRTIQRAADSLLPGDTVYIRAGTFRERVLPLNSGSDAAHWITYSAYPGEVVTIDGTGINVPADEGLIYILQKSYIRMAGLQIVHSSYAGLLAEDSDHITIENIRTYDTASSGIGIWGGSHVLLAGNRVEQAGSNGMQECITVAGTGTFEVRDCEVLQCRKEGITAKDGASNGKIWRNRVHHTDHVGIYVDGEFTYTFNIEVFQNTIHDIVYKDGITVATEAGGLVENVSIYNNLTYDNGFFGIGISACCPVAEHHPIRNVRILNNTVCRNGTSGWGGGISIGENPDLEGIVVRNNIVSQNVSFQIAADAAVPPASLAVDHNLIDGYRDYEGETDGTDMVLGDPRFVNPAAADFHLRPGSPAIGKGSSLLAPAQDHDGFPRPPASIDLGALQFIPWRLFLSFVMR